MTEAYVKLFKLKEVYTQTDDLSFNLTERKTVRMYYSQAYKEKVLSLNLGLQKVLSSQSTCGIISKKNLKI